MIIYAHTCTLYSAWLGLILKGQTFKDLTGSAAGWLWRRVDR